MFRPVLGAANVSLTPTLPDCDNPTAQINYIGNSTLNKPSEISGGGGYLITIDASLPNYTHRFQFMYNVRSDRYFIRTRGDESWNSWKELP